MPRQFVKSQKGTDQLIYKGFIYLLEKRKPGITIWRCVEYENSKCRGRVHTNHENVIFDNENHNHTARIGVAKAKEAMNEIKTNARNWRDTPQAIVADTVQTMPDYVAVRMRYMIRTINRTRKADGGHPTSPRNLIDLHLPAAYTVTAKNDNFLL
uniref:FLYWCH-type domain-containing protein n=1 Tax=Strigamia maritima TaxID=126957 RepID=T1IZP7_STRMM